MENMMMVVVDGPFSIFVVSRTVEMTSVVQFPAKAMTDGMILVLYYPMLSIKCNSGPLDYI